MKFESSSRLEELIWQSRIADLPRGEDRAILLRLYNGEPPFDTSLAEENNIEINRNDLSGVNLLAQARRQWNQAHLKPGNYFTCTLDSGPIYKREEWARIITKEINRRLKRSKAMREQIRAVGGNMVLYGIGPSMWRDRICPVPNAIPVSSLLIPSETEIDFENLEWFSVFREWTPAQLYDMTHGPRVDPGWNMQLVMQRFREVSEQMQKAPNSIAYQYMPERIEELIKQDKGFWGSDAVPTIDVWDTYFREAEDGKGWYRRILLDWGVPSVQMGTYGKSRKPESKNKIGDKDVFLYSSGKRKYADSLSEILHCQFGDCSALFPQKYHSVRSLGWMCWGVCDLNNRLYCKSMENAFQQFMWFFRNASNQDWIRLKRANFLHLGIIPQGISFIPAQERYKPDVQLVEGAFARNRQMMNESAASYVQDYTRQDRGQEKTATEIMAVINSINAMVSGTLSLSYSQAEDKYREIARRFCIKTSPDVDVRKFRLACLKQGVPAEMLNSERWDISAEKVLGGGNKTLEMAIAQGLQTIRPNLGPDAQRKADHIFIDALSDNPALAEDMAPISEIKYISASTHDAQLASERLLKGLPYTPPKNAVPEDYIIVWLHDMMNLLQQIEQTGGMANEQQIIGLANLGQTIGMFIQQMSQSEGDKARVKEYQTALANAMNVLKGLVQRFKEQKAAGNGGTSGIDAETQAKIASATIIAKAKAANTRESHAQRTAQRQIAFEMQEQRKDRESAAEIRRKNMEDAVQSINKLKSFQD